MSRTLVAAFAAICAAASAQAQTVPPAEVRAIVRDATIYGFPLVDSYHMRCM
jgi:hypothetical protein